MKYLTPLATFLIGTFLGYLFNPFQNSHKSVNLQKTSDTKPIVFSKQKSQKEKLFNKSKNLAGNLGEDQDDKDFDEYTYEMKRKESLEEWNESIEMFFEDNAIATDIYHSYRKLQQELEKEKETFWYKAMEKSKVNDNEYLYNTTYEDDLKMMNIRTMYHNKLKTLLGITTYQKLRQKIKDYKKEQVRRAQQGQYHGVHIHF